ncbi:MAG: NAD(P)H-binding protein [Proteobacteria bacterium]|nr:NAD(P)H-binding protein [Pseudomonadota bacterium]
MSNYFLTGGTGRLGRPLALYLVRAGHELSLLVRKESRRSAREWLAELRTTEADTARRIRLVTGDLTRPELLDKRDRASLEGVEVVVHAGAYTGPKQDRGWVWSHNVRGTTHTLGLAAELPHLRRFVHISDVAVSGDITGPFSETDLLRGQQFEGTAYAESKMVAERRVRASDVPWTVLRAARNAPVDWLVEAASALAEHPGSLRRGVHLVDPDSPSNVAVYDTRHATRLLRPLGLELVEYARERGV